MSEIDLRRVWSAPDTTQPSAAIEEVYCRLKSFKKLLAGVVKRHHTVIFTATIRPSQVISLSPTKAK